MSSARASCAFSLQGTSRLDKTAIHARSPDYMVRGYKAALKNSSVSGQAKERARQVLDTEFKEYGKSGESHEECVIAAHKVLLHNPRVSDAEKGKALSKFEEPAIVS
ncbi:hypothetical protein ACEPAF_3594 [Sanghuangporus sanghuang]